MKKRILISIILVLSLASCGYNKIMYDQLSNSNNYTQYDATIVKIYYEKDNTLHEDYQSEHILDAESVLLEVSLNSKKEIAPFLGVSEESLDKDCSEYTVRLEIISENNRILCEKGFYNNVKEGTTVTLKASDLIYQDSEFFYISSVMYDGVEYLNESVGLLNIVDMMDGDKSLF